MDLRKAQFIDNYDEDVINFLTDAPQKTIDAIPEIEWNHIKELLLNMGYTVIEIPNINIHKN